MESKRQSGTREPDQQEWIPTTDLGVLVKLNKVTMEDISRFSLRIKEPGIIDHLFKGKLKDEVLKIKSVQKQTKAGQRTRMKAVVVVGDGEGYVGLGKKTAKEAAVAIRGALEQAKMNLRPVKLGYWGASYGAPHTVPCKATGRAGSVLLRLIPAPKGSGIVAASVVKKICSYAGIKDIFTKSNGQTCTTENFAKATINALDEASNFFSPDMWGCTSSDLNPLVVNAGFLVEYKKKAIKK